MCIIVLSLTKLPTIKFKGYCILNKILDESQKKFKQIHTTFCVYLSDLGSNPRPPPL